MCREEDYWWPNSCARNRNRFVEGFVVTAPASD
jgi:hypothetical protein